MKRRLTSLLAFIVAIAFKAGCSSCFIGKEQEAVKGEQASDAYAFSLKKAIDLKAPFSYSHVLSLTLIDHDKQAINVEHVQAVSDSLALHFKKKIDDQHFFELWHENSDYLVKNRLGPWRKSAENKPMYIALIDEGLGALSWIIAEFGLGPLLASPLANDGKNKVFIIEDKALAPDAPFLTKLASLPEFKVVKATIKGRLELDKLSNMPLSSRFSITIDGGSQAIKFESETLFAQELKEPLHKPQAVEEGPLLYPVNIAPRFNQLMKHEQGDDK